MYQIIEPGLKAEREWYFSILLSQDCNHAKVSNIV